MIIHRPVTRERRLPLPRPGGDRLSGPLARRLDDRYHYLRRVFAGNGDPIDSVVVGPGGIWALTLKAERGRFRKRNGHWYHWSDDTDSWIPWEAKSVVTARLAGHRLEQQLERAALPAVVVACLAPPRGVEIGWEPGQRPGIQVLADVETLAARISANERLTAAQVERIVALLDPHLPLPQMAGTTRSAGAPAKRRRAGDSR
ncbi:MAG: NERD domain-containing protein [Chloroflexota bacterium]|nr:NERD domain-containing protein [Chloroflexota bacterium]